MSSFMIQPIHTLIDNFQQARVAQFTKNVIEVSTLFSIEQLHFRDHEWSIENEPDMEIFHKGG